MLKSARLGLRPRATVTPAEPLPSFSSYGSQTIVYLDPKDCVLCAACATLARAEGKNVVGHAFDEGAACDCEECGEIMHATYGDPHTEDGEGLTEVDLEIAREERGEG